MTNPATTSLLDRANLDRDQVRNEVARGLAGADDGELFLEYSQTEALMFDNGRLKQATYDTSQGFGLRGATVTDVKQLKGLMEEYEKGDTTMVWDVITSDKVVTPKMVAGVKAGHGVR